MFIRNIKTGLIQECTNKDVIKVCRKDPENFEVTEVNPKAYTSSEKGPEFETTPEPEVQQEPESEKKMEDMTVPELKALAKEKGIDGTSSLNKEDLLAVLKDVV